MGLCQHCRFVPLTGQLFNFLPHLSLISHLSRCVCPFLVPVAYVSSEGPGSPTSDLDLFNLGDIQDLLCSDSCIIKINSETNLTHVFQHLREKPAITFTLSEYQAPLKSLEDCGQVKHLYPEPHDRLSDRSVF